MDGKLVDFIINYLKELEEKKKKILEISSNPEAIILWEYQIQLIIASALIDKESNYLVELFSKLNNNLLSEFPHKEYTEKVIKDIQNICSIIIKKIDDVIIMIKREGNKRGINLK